MVQSEFNLMLWFVSYNIFFIWEKAGHALRGIQSLSHACPRRALTCAIFRGYAMIADRLQFPGAVSFYSIWYSISVQFGLPYAGAASLMAGCVGIRFRVTLRDNGPFGAVGGPSHCDELSPMNGKVILECWNLAAQGSFSFRIFFVLYFLFLILQISFLFI
jgi:hypothetical protein